MYRKKNYLKYYKRNYSKSEKLIVRNTKLFFACIFMLILFLSVIFVFYISINSESVFKSETDISCTNQVVSIKKKSLRTDFSAWNKICDWNLIVVNNINSIPEYFSPALKEYGEFLIDERIILDLSEMIGEASQNNIQLWVSSAYRTNERQEQLFNMERDKHIQNGVNINDAIDIAMKIVSRPGYNEHNTGLAVDFNAADDDFYSTKEYEWLVENSTNYGFILRYPKEKENITGRAYEPGHFRYVGLEHALNMKSQNLCFEEYISMLIK